MDSARVLRGARVRAGLTQRQLAKRAKVPQPAIARIESGRVVPRVDTLERLLRECGESLDVRPRLGEGVDRTLIQQMLQLTPDERVKAAARASRGLARIRAGMKR